MSLDPDPKRESDVLKDEISSSPREIAPPVVYGLIAIAAVVIIAMSVVAVQHRHDSGEGGQATYAVGESSLSTLGSVVVVPPSGSYVRYADPSHRQRKFGDDGEAPRKASVTADDASDARAAAAAKAARDAAAVQAKADAATAAAGEAAAKQAAANSAAPASATPSMPVANFSPVGRWVRQDGANDYQFFRSDGIWYESDGTESNAAADTFPDSAHWQIDAAGDTTYVTTGADRFTVLGADTIRGERSGTYIRVGE